MTIRKPHPSDRAGTAFQFHGALVFVFSSFLHAGLAAENQDRQSRCEHALNLYGSGASHESIGQVVRGNTSVDPRDRGRVPRLGAIVCMSNTGEAMSSRHDRPPLTYAGSTKDGIRGGADFADLAGCRGEPDLTVTQADFFGAGQVSQHACFGLQVWGVEKEGRVIEISLEQPGWARPAAGNNKQAGQGNGR